MSTRCVVRVKLDRTADSVKYIKGEFHWSLYHHCDGYPEGMIPLLKSAELASRESRHLIKVPNFIIAQDPGGYEMEDWEDKHGDLDYLYLVRVLANRCWEVKVRRRIDWDGHWAGDSMHLFGSQVENNIKAVARASS